jgi:hypothetical protein
LSAPGTTLSLGGTATPLAGLPMRPSMPTNEDQERSVMTANRAGLLTEQWDDLLDAWLSEHIDKDSRSAWGPPDTSANPLADLARQLSTPGLYGVRPDYRHPDAAAQGLIGPEGHLAKAGWTTKMQWVQYMVLGLGDYFLRLDVPTGSDELTIRLVAPQDVYALVDEDRPDRPVVLWELRLRWWEAKCAWVYCWDQYDLGESRPGRTAREPSYRVVLAARPNLLDDGDVSNVFLGKPGGYRGAEYPYRDERGKPVLPYVKYTATDSGRMWNHLDKRGAARGTLNAALYWTYAGHAAKSASGKAVMAIGVEPIGAVQEAQDSNDARVRTIRITPGAIVYHTSMEGGQGTFQEIGPGAEIEKLAAFADHYEMKQAVRWGLDPTDITRQSANPSSGAALLISARGKRAFSRQVEEVFRRADLEVLRLAAILLRVAGVGTYPESGYSVTYHEIPDSPQEQADKRAQADWEIAKDFLSPEQAYVRWHPGVSEENAASAIVGSRLARMRIEKRANEIATAEGLVAPKAEAERLVGIEEIKRQTLISATKSEIPVETAARLLMNLGVTPEDVEAMVAPIRAALEAKAKAAPQSNGNAPDSGAGGEGRPQGGQEHGGQPAGPKGEMEMEGEHPEEEHEA